MDNSSYSIVKHTNNLNTFSPNPLEALLLELLIAVLFLLMYFLPSLIATNKKKKNSIAIFALNFLLSLPLLISVGYCLANSKNVLAIFALNLIFPINLLLGLAFVGWVGSLVWALTNE